MMIPLTNRRIFTMKDMKKMKVISDLRFTVSRMKNYIFVLFVFFVVNPLWAVDHGTLWGLYDDDHPQYIRKDGTRPLDADWDAGDYTITALGIDCNDLSVYAMDANSLGLSEALTLEWMDPNGVLYIGDANELSISEYLTWDNDSNTLTVGALTLTDGSVTDGSGNIDFNTTDLQGIGSLAFGDFTSLVPTGTAPFFCDSTTVCTNLNADLLDGESASAFQDADTGLTSLAGLSYSAASFVKMTAADTFTLDTNTYYKSGDSIVTANVEPTADNTHYLGKNDDDSPAAYKGLILKDTTNGKYYRIEVINGTLTATDLTD